MIKISISYFGKFDSISKSLKWEVDFLVLCFYTWLSTPVPILCLSLTSSTVQTPNNCFTVRNMSISLGEHGRAMLGGVTVPALKADR